MNKHISLVVPTLHGGFDAKGQLDEQSLEEVEVIEVVGVNPNGRARNQGWKQAEGEIIVFLDDDATFGHEKVLENLVQPIQENQADIVGASRLLPPNSNWFAKRAAREIPLIETSVVDKLTEANPTLVRQGSRDRSIWAPITTTCVAMRREVLEETAGFNEEINWGVDTEFFYRARKVGFEFVLAPNTWVYHPYASDLQQLWRKYFKSGLGTAQEMKLNPERNLKPILKTPLHVVGFLVYRLVASIGLVLILKPLRAFSTFASAVGYVYGKLATLLLSHR